MNTPPAESNGTGDAELDDCEDLVMAMLVDLGLLGEVYDNSSSVEMMEKLRRGLMKWQGEYGKWGDK